MAVGDTSKPAPELDDLRACSRGGRPYAPASVSYGPPEAVDDRRAHALPSPPSIRSCPRRLVNGRSVKFAKVVVQLLSNPELRDLPMVERICPGHSAMDRRSFWLQA